jgi:hypothetical protein
MFIPQEKACCFLLLAEHKSVITVQRAFRREFNKDPPHENNISLRFHQFEATGSVVKQSRKGKTKVIR